MSCSTHCPCHPAPPPSLHPATPRSCHPAASGARPPVAALCNGSAARGRGRCGALMGCKRRRQLFGATRRKGPPGRVGGLAVGAAGEEKDGSHIQVHRASAAERATAPSLTTLTTLTTLTKPTTNKRTCTSRGQYSCSIPQRALKSAGLIWCSTPWTQPGSAAAAAAAALLLPLLPILTPPAAAAAGASSKGTTLPNPPL